MYRYTSTPEDTVKAGLRGGCDLNCGSFYQKNGMVCVGAYFLSSSSFNSFAQDAYNKKTITDDDLNTAMTRLFTYR